MIQHSAACERNKGPILEILQRVFSDSSRVLEIASGTGMHAVHMAQSLPHLVWQPTDTSTAAIDSIRAWCELQPSANLQAPIELDVRSEAWPVTAVDAIFNANMIHISPWATTEGLLAGASRVLPEGGLLAMYGPYKINGAHTAPSNAQFDQSLRARDPSWGVRNLEEVMTLAISHDLHFIERVQMPANNQVVVFRRG